MGGRNAWDHVSILNAQDDSFRRVGKGWFWNYIQTRFNIRLQL